jgi:Uncharacterised protein family (UPF0149)
MMVRTIREAAMRAQALAHAIPLDQVDLEALDRFLMSDRSPPDCMTLSDLDGFLTGIAIGPELVLPSEWLPLIWGGKAPEFADGTKPMPSSAPSWVVTTTFSARSITTSSTLSFWVHNGTLIAVDWADGFLHAILLRMDAWDENGESLLDITPDEEEASQYAATSRRVGIREKPRIQLRL